MLSKSLLLISILVISGCCTTVPKVQVNKVVIENLKLEEPIKPKFEDSKNIKWNLNSSTDTISTDRNSFLKLLEDLVKYSSYTAKLESNNAAYKEYLDKLSTK